VSERRGFTLIELLVVVVIIGLLASIAVARFGAVKDRAYVSAMQADLRSALMAQLSYAETQNPPAFAETVAELGDRFRPSAGVTITFSSASPTGFGALATHAATTRRCAIFQGAAVTAPATEEGKLTCD
jgi:prepilin-type N-terminal cleavage/methylation domain-containing protein